MYCSNGAAWTINMFGTFWSLFLTKTCPAAIAYKIYLDLSGTDSDQSADAYVPTHTNY